MNWQNFIERAVILSPGTSLRAPLDELTQETVKRSEAQFSRCALESSYPVQQSYRLRTEE
jgi:hypothetical protein